jgi:hypothetical protein
MNKYKHKTASENSVAYFKTFIVQAAVKLMNIIEGTHEKQ